MLSSTIDYRPCVQCPPPPQDLNRLSPFILRQFQFDFFAFFQFDFFAFQASGLQVVSYYPALARRILHWQMAWSQHLNKDMLILSDLELPAMPYVAPITAISQLPEYRLYYAHEIIGGLVGR